MNWPHLLCCNWTRVLIAADTFLWTRAGALEISFHLFSGVDLLSQFRNYFHTMPSIGGFVSLVHFLDACCSLMQQMQATLTSVFLKARFWRFSLALHCDMFWSICFRDFRCCLRTFLVCYVESDSRITVPKRCQCKCTGAGFFASLWVLVRWLFLRSGSGLIFCLLHI